MKLNIVDLELNQPSGKVIQIGAVRINIRTGEILSKFNTYVNPEETLDPYIVDLCHITQEQVDSAPTIVPALKAWWGWVDGKHVGAWGRDVKLLADLSNELGVDTPHFSTYDLLPMGTILRNGVVNGGSGGLRKTMTTFGLDFEGQPHNALDDALNTAKLAFTWVDMVSKYTKIREVLND